MKKFSYCILALFCISLAHAQKSKPGITILASGDTLRGNLSISAFERYACEVNSIRYTPEQVNSFYIPGEVYFEKAVIKDNSVFAEVLVSGKIDLLERNDAYYLRDESNDVILLESVKQTRIVDNKEYVAISDKYKTLLREKFVDCPAAQADINGTSLSRKSLTALFIEYNECFGIKSTTTVTVARHRSRWYLGVGYNTIQSKLVGLQKGWEYTTSNFHDKTSQNAVSFFLQYNPGALKNFSIQLSGYNTSFAYHAERTLSVPVSSGNGNGYKFETYVYKYNLKYNSFALPVMVQYSFFTSRIVQPYIGLGTALHFASKFSGDELITDPSNKQHHRALGDLTKSDASLLRAQLGVNLKLNAFLIGGGITYDYMHVPLGFASVAGGKFTGHQKDILGSFYAAFAFAR